MRQGLAIRIPLSADCCWRTLAQTRIRSWAIVAGVAVGYTLSYSSIRAAKLQTYSEISKYCLFFLKMRLSFNYFSYENNIFLNLVLLNAMYIKDTQYFILNFSSTKVLLEFYFSSTKPLQFLVIKLYKWPLHHFTRTFLSHCSLLFEQIELVGFPILERI